MVDLTELDGVGESRAENLAGAGYESVEDLADADHEAIAEEVNYLPKDTALDLIVQSQNVMAEQDAEVEESQPVTEEVEAAIEETEGEPKVEEVEAEPEESEKETVEEVENEPVEEESDIEEEPEPEESEPEESGETTYEVEVEFSAPLQYDTFFDSLMGQRSKMLRTNRSGVDVFDHALTQMRNGGMSEPVVLTMNKSQLNDLHNSVRQKSIEYKGDNLIDHMDEINEVLNQINAARDEHLF